MYQVTTLQALNLGYSRAVVSASELLEQGQCVCFNPENSVESLRCKEVPMVKATAFPALR